MPVSARFFATLAGYLQDERPETATAKVFVVLKGSATRSAAESAGLDEIIRGASRRSQVAVTCHQLRRALAALDIPTSGGHQ